MIAKGNSRNGTAAAIKYVLDEKKIPKILSRNDLIGNDHIEMAGEMRLFQKLNQRTKNNIMHFQISPSPEDNLTDKQLNKVCKAFIEKMKMSDRQYLIVKHSDKPHKHAHILVNRIDANGNCYDDSFIRVKCKQVGHDVAISMNLLSAKMLEEEKKKKIKDLKKEIKLAHQKVMKLRIKTFKEWSEKMKLHGIKIMPHTSKFDDSNTIIGYRLKYKGHNLKISDIDRNMTISKMTHGKGTNPKMKQTLTPRVERNKSIGFSR